MIFNEGEKDEYEKLEDAIGELEKIYKKFSIEGTINKDLKDEMISSLKRIKMDHIDGNEERIHEKTAPKRIKRCLTDIVASSRGFLGGYLGTSD